MARDQSRRRKRGFNEVAQSDSYSNSNDTRTRDGREDFHGIRGRWNNLGRKKSVKSELWIFSFLCSLPSVRGCFLSFYFFESEIKIEILRDTQGEVAVLRRNNVWRMREFSRERYESFMRQRESIRRVCYQGTSFGIAIGTEDLCCVCTCFVPRSFIHLTQRCMEIRMVLTLRIRRGSSSILLHSVPSPLIHTKIIS